MLKQLRAGRATSSRSSGISLFVLRRDGVFYQRR